MHRMEPMLRYIREIVCFRNQTDFIYYLNLLFVFLSGLRWSCCTISSHRNCCCCCSRNYCNHWHYSNNCSRLQSAIQSSLQSIRRLPELSELGLFADWVQWLQSGMGRLLQLLNISFIIILFLPFAHILHQLLF